MSIGMQTSKTELALYMPKKQDLRTLRTYCMFGLRLSHMSCDEVELEKIVKSRFHYDQLASPLVSYMSRNSPSLSPPLVEKHDELDSVERKAYLSEECCGNYA